MKQIILAIALTLFTATVAAAPTDWYPGKKAQGLAAFYTVLCEDVLGGVYGYEQLESGPTGWACVTPSHPQFNPIRDIILKRRGEQ